MAATEAELDEDSWLYGDGYTENKKLNDNGDAKPEEGIRSGSPLLDDLDDAIVNVSVKQQVTNKIVSVSNSLQPKAATPSEEIPLDDGVFDLDQDGEGVTEGGGGGEVKGGEEDEEEEDSESDEDDVQIHIGPIDTQAPPFYQGRLPSVSGTSLTGPKKVDVDAVPTIGGQSIYELDLDSADKPWRLPGADITDYFNYGFTEETWRLYCDKQRRTKNEVIQLNKIAVHTTRIGTLSHSGSIMSTIPSLGGGLHSSLPPLPLPPFHLPAGLPIHPSLLPPPLPHLPIPHTLHEPPPSQEMSSQSQERGEDGKTPERDGKEEGSDGRATPGVDQEGYSQDGLAHQGKLPLLPHPTSSAGQDHTTAMAAMLRGLRPEPPFPNFLPPPGFPPPFPPNRPRVPFHGGPPPPFPMLPGGPLDVPGMLPPHLDERGLPIHPELGLPIGPGGGWDPSMGPPPELFEMMARREGMEYARGGGGGGSRSPSRSGSSGHSQSRSRSSSYDDRKGGRRRERRRRYSRSRSHSRDRDRDKHSRSSRRHRSGHHRSERYDRERDRDRDREREKERERRRRDERSRRERSRRHRSSSRDREDDRSSTTGRSTRERKNKDGGGGGGGRDERSRSHTPT